MEMTMKGTARAILPRSFASEALPRSLGRALRRYWLGYMNWRLQRLTIDLLSRMSDRELEDMGLTRWHIELAARGQIDLHPLPSARLS
jgi:uncharacterized protein YjiS (DUF1127 family)